MDISVPDKASSSSPFSKGWLYDVFISFRGEDTRKNFTGHLYEALTKAGINAFIDDEELKKGEELKPTFERAIQGSKISIIVFSRQYANSSWCLEELVKIMECRRTLGQLVLAIFHDVDPSHVRKQTDDFGQLFLEHIDEKKVESCKEERWRTELTEASNLSGWDLRNTLDGHETKFIRMITEEVTRKLNNTYLDVAPYQVGIDSRVQDISNYLCIGDSDDVRVIGILGMGGIGKTTLAKAIYNQFSDRFRGKSFLEKVREKKVEKLQKQLLSDILQTTKTKVSSVAAGTALVGERFRCLKVLVIVDDVDDVKQLRELAGNCHSFGPGSRIIITTRNEHVLKEFAVDKIYQPKQMDGEEALELLIWHAFRSSCCPSEYLVLAREVVNYCGGLPLALEVLGSTLFKQSIGDWKSTLDKLKEIPLDNIQEQLKISYKGLNDDYEREIFRDISCFFIGMDKNDVMQILDGCGFYATAGIKVLRDRCLLTFNTKNKIMMHDLLRDMGRDIVRAENSKFPRERSRLWRPEDVKAVLIDKSGTEKIEGLALDLPSVEDNSFSTEAFTNIKSLRLLQLKYVRLTGGYQCLSKKLRWLCYHGFPLKFIPVDLCQPNIVAIDMRYSSLEQILCGYSGLLDKLKILNLSHSHDLTQSPDFSKLPNLEKLILKGCKRLAKVHKSIGDLKNLVLVNLKDCETLQALPRRFYKSKSVKTLVLNGCSTFKILSETLGKMASLNTLLIDGTAIEKVPPSMVRLEKLERLSMSYLKCPLQLPSLRGLRSLTDLILKGSNLMEVPNDIGSSLPCLRYLVLDKNNFRSLPSLSGLSMLHSLQLNSCRNLVEITDLPQNLDILEVEDCFALERMPDFSGMSTCVNLGCPKLIEFPGLDSALNLGLVLYMSVHNKVIDFLLQDNTLQGWTGRGLMNLVGRQIPTWFNHVNEGTQVSFEVPKEIGCNAKALAVCLACCPYDGDRSKFWSYIYVINDTKRTSFYVEIIDVSSREENLWLGNLSLSETEFNLEEGDLVKVIARCLVTVVEKIGVRLVCNNLMTFRDSYFSYHSIPYDRALEKISKEDDDFDEDDDNDDEDDDDEEDQDDEDDDEDQDDDEDGNEDDDDDDTNDEDDDNHGDDDDEPVVHSLESDKPETGSIEGIGGGGGGGQDEEEEPVDKPDDPMEEDVVNPASVFCIRLKQPRSNLQHQMSVPELCRNFSAVAWCGKLNAIACASETCASIPSSNANAPFWIPIRVVIPERPTKCAVFNVNADSPHDSLQFIEWSPTSCPRALLVANFHGRVTIWTQPSQGPANLVHNASRWQREHEWRQDIAVVTKWLSGVSPWLSSKSSTSSNGKSTFEEKSLSQQSQNSARWPSFLCVCSVFSSGSVQLHWSQYPPNQTGAAPKWLQTSEGLLGVGHSGIMAADAIITDSGAMHVAGVPIVNPSTVFVWEVTPGLGNRFHTTPKISTTNGVPPSINPPIWAGFSPLAAYLFSWQDYLLSEAKQRRKQTDQDFSDTVALHCSLVSNFSAYVSPEAASQSATTTTWGSGVTAVAFDPTSGGSVIAVVIVEGQYMSPYDPDEGPSITGWRVQRWESSLQPVFLHHIFGNPTSSFGGQAPMQTVWLSKVDTSIQPTNDFKSHQAAATTATTDARKTADSGIEKVKRVSFNPFDLPIDVRTLARIVYSAHGGEIAVAFLRGGVHIFSGSNFAPVDNYQINVGSAIAAPAFSSTSCCSASVWHDSGKDNTVLKIIRVLPPAVPSSQVKANSSTWERAIAERFWWSLFVGLDWWDVVGCTRSAAEDGIVSLNSVIAVLDAKFYFLPSTQHRQRFGPSLDKLKCRLLEGTNAQEVGAMVLHKQTRLLNPSALVPEPWYEEQDDDKKRELEMKIEELMNPNTTSLNAPKEKIKTKGRPYKVDNSTRRLPSAFEIIEVELAQSEFDCQTPVTSTMASVSTVSRRKRKQKENVTTPSNKKRKGNVITLPKTKQKMNFAATSPIVNADIVLDQLNCETDMYREAFPEAIREYITGQTDVTRDGNCGYRIISMALGIDNGWRKVRRDLLHQLRQMPSLFQECFVGNDRYTDIERALDYFEDGIAPTYTWLTMPDMGHIIATCYNVVLIHLSMTQCITFLPYSLEPSSQSSDTNLREVAIGYLTEDHHFIQVHLCKGHPMPPISTMWHKKSQTSSDIRVKNLYSKYQGRVDQFKQLRGLKNVATNDIVDLEDD